MSPLDLRRYRAERLLRSEFAGLRSKVLAIVRSKLRAKGISLDPGDLDACYAQAWHGLYATVLAGERIDEPAAWLVLVTFRRAIDESRSRSALALAGDAASVPVEDPDVAQTLDDRARLRHVLEGLRGQLSERECRAASLCYLQGLSRAAAAAAMGISEARMRKLMDGYPGRTGVAGKVGALLNTVRAGGWCESQSSLMRAYAFGILDPDGERHALAVAHCRECPACRAHVASLRGLAALLPPLPLRLAKAGAGVTAGSGAVGANGAGMSLPVGGTLAAKLAAIGVVVLGVGSGYTLLVNGERGHTARSAPVSASVPVSSKHSPVHAHRARSRRARRTHTRAHTVTPLHPVASSSGQNRRSPEVSASLGEFTPERVPRER